MKAKFAVAAALLIALLVSASLAGATEWGGYTVPVRGQANSCARGVGDTLSIRVVDNLTYGVSGSEAFSVIVPGVGPVAGYGDGEITGPIGGPNILTVTVSTAYSVPANSILTVQYTSYREREFRGDSATYTLEYNCTTGAVVSSGLPFSDERVNQQPSASAALYCTENSGLEIWSIDARGNGQFLFTVTPREISRVVLNPQVNTVIDQAQGPRGTIQVYRLTSGEFALISPGQAGDDTKVYDFVFPGCIARG